VTAGFLISIEASLSSESSRFFFTCNGFLTTGLVIGSSLSLSESKGFLTCLGAAVGLALAGAYSSSSESRIARGFLSF
jgi:hypothetical protein